MCVKTKSDVFSYMCYFCYFVCLHTGYSTIISQGKLSSGETCYYDGHSSEDDFCLTLGSTPLSWEESSQACSTRAGTLIQEDSEITLGFLQQLMTATGWQRSWLGGKKEPQEWQWFGGELLEESNFMEWNELPSDENKDCVEIVPYKQYAWEDASCGQTHGYICETSAASKLCEEASNIFYEVLVSSGRCFMLSHSHVAVNWFSAKKECERYGASLGHLNFQGIHDRLVSIQPGIQGNVNGYWIGATKAQWYWGSNKTSESIEHFHWEDSQPNRSGNCLVLERFSGELYRWANWNCSDKLNYMCQHDKQLLSEDAPTTLGTFGNTHDKPSSHRSSSHSSVPSVTDPASTESNNNSSITQSTEPLPSMANSMTSFASMNHTPPVIMSETPSTTWSGELSSEDNADSTTETSTVMASVSVILDNFTLSSKDFNLNTDTTSSNLDTSTPSIGYTTPLKSEQCHFIDLCWTIENHPDTTRSNWTDVLSLIIKSTELLQFSDKCFQVSAIMYDLAVRKVYHFRESRDKADFIGKIRHLPFLGTNHNVNISTAFNSLYQEIFTYSNGVRRESQKLAVLIKSGKTLLTDIDILAIELASKLKTHGVYIGALSVNSVVEKNEAENILNTVTSHPAHIFQQHIQKYTDLHNETVVQKLLYLFEYLSTMLAMSTTSAEVTQNGRQFTALSVEEENSTVLTVLLAAIVSFAVLIVVTSVIIAVLLMKRRRQRKGIRSRIFMTTVSDKSLTTYEELAAQSSISGYSGGSAKSNGSHGSSRQKIARMKRHNISILHTKGGITTPWGSMRSSRRSRNRTPRSSIEHLTGGSWPTE